MAGFYYYSTSSDWPVLLRELIGIRGFTWFRSGPYSVSTPQVLTEENVDEIAASGAPQFYAVPGPSGIVPRMTAIADGLWRISTFESPDMLVCNLPRHFEKDGWRLVNGDIYYPASGVLSDPERRARLRVFHLDIVKRLKKALLRSKMIGGRRVWLTAATVAALKGGAVINIRGKFFGSEALGK